MTLVFVLSVLFGGVGITGAVAAFFKVRPERDSIIVTAAQGAVLVQTTILDELKAELKRVSGRADEIAGEQIRLREELATVTHERNYLRDENRRLQQQVGKLEHRVGELERNGH